MYLICIIHSFNTKFETMCYDDLQLIVKNIFGRGGTNCKALGAPLSVITDFGHDDNTMTP